MAAPVSLPRAFDSSTEPNKLLARAKKKASKNFRWTSSQCLADGLELAFLAHVFGKDDEALEVCRFLGQYQFTGDFRRWWPVEVALCLQSRLLRQHRETQEATACMQRVRDAGFVATRLEGGLLSPGNAERAERDGARSIERDYRLAMLGELCFIIELGGSDALPVAALEKTYAENFARLRVLLGADS